MKRNNFGWAVKAARTHPENKLTQFDLAVKSQVPLHRIQACEAGRIELEEAELKAISKALGIAFSCLVRLARLSKGEIGGQKNVGRPL